MTSSVILSCAAGAAEATQTAKDNAAAVSIGRMSRPSCLRSGPAHHSKKRGRTVSIAEPSCVVARHFHRHEDSIMSDLQIIGAPASNFVWVTRLACAEKGVPYTLVPTPPHTPEVNA